MTFYELTNSMTIQGNIEIALFDESYNELDREYFPNEDDFYSHSFCDGEYDDCEVRFMFPQQTSNGISYLVIELVKEED